MSSSRLKRRFRPLWQRKPHFIMPSVEAPFLAGGGTTALPDTWPNGVPYIDEDTRRENLQDPARLHDLIQHIQLHDAYSGYGLVRTMTTEQKELFADVLDLDRGDPELDRLKYDRWWRR